MLTPAQIELLTNLESQLNTLLANLPATEIKRTLATAKRSLGAVIEKALEQ